MSRALGEDPAALTTILPPSPQGRKPMDRFRKRRMAPRESSLRTAAELTEKVLRQYRLWSVVVAQRTVDAWPRAVGERVASHTRAERLDGSTLHVRVDSSAWLQELTLLRPMLLANLRNELGDPSVEQLKLHLG